MTQQYTKPLPTMRMNPALSQAFWDATKRHEVVIPHCKTCNRFHFYPREQCPYCMSDKLEWVKVSGEGRLYAYTVVYQPMSPAFNNDVPYINCVIELNEGVRLPSNLVDVNVADYMGDAPKDKINQAVVPVFEDVTPEWTLLKFKPA